MSSGFISEAEITEQRRMRQEEWERVRTADQPLDCKLQRKRTILDRCMRDYRNRRINETSSMRKLTN
ncbi:hypothetical protein DMN91_011315 [Ooceraea biroi]|uniref:FAM192A/Fyv6 N-terminal domain-containing protein n=1 Tax=Ooceraea biroi TaxID=2015173 RepID=A0A3L8DA85_OOCBI|nr:hypothetical protein DMN91_011315 [Ooceraea biroi]